MTGEPDRQGVRGRLRARWGVGPWGILAILLAFSLAGMTVLKISRPIIDFLLPSNAPRWLWWTVRIVVIVPVYEGLLLGYGVLLGQRRFFWDKQKKLTRVIVRFVTGGA